MLVAWDRMGTFGLGSSIIITILITLSLSLSHLQIQFVLVMVHAFQLLFKNDCNFPAAFAYFIGAHALMFYFLFSSFYKSAYTQKQEALKRKKAEADADEKKPLKAATATTNGHAPKQLTNGTAYEKVDGSVMEDSFSATRQRVFIGSNGWICQPVHIN